MTVKNVVFGEATEVDNRFQIDGLFGMAWPAIAEDGMSVVFQQMIDQGVVDTPVFGFYLNRYVHIQMYCCELIVIIMNVRIAIHRIE